MSFVHFNLNLSANLAMLAPAPLPAGGFGVAALPPGMGMAGTYIIVNTATNNRYIGISGNIAGRFNNRLPTVTEMGFGVVTMGAIGVTWGQTFYRNTGAVFNMLAIPAPPAAYQVLIDGFWVNLERLLIRFVINQLGAGGTVSNNVYAAIPYMNPTPNPVTVRLTWGGMGGLFAPNFLQVVWGVGAAW